MTVPLAAVGLLLSLVVGARSDTLPLPGTGVSHALARERAAAYRDVAYDFDLRIPGNLAAPIAAEGTIRFALSAPRPRAVLDFKQPRDHLKTVSLDGAPVRWRLGNGHLLVEPDGGLAAGQHAVGVDFVAGDGSLNRNADYMYALFVPDRASVALPVFDQPDLKARFTLSLEVPPDWVAVTNGAETSVDTLPGGRTRHAFATTHPIPTYLFTFAAGRWRVETAERDGRTFRMFHRESDSTRVARNVDAIFDLQAKALKWLEDYTGIPYPWGKFDFVAVPAFQFGGMEHPGAIYYRAESLFLDESATQSQKLGRASVLAHETAHMWFGDLVTMRWFDDVWTKEVYANFMAAKVVNPSFPEVDHALRFYLAHFPAAYAVDRTAGTHPIHQSLDNLANAGTLYGNIIYDKAPIVMQHLENRIGADSLQAGLREYLKRFAFGNATWDELVAILDRRTPEDLTAWSRVWVDEPGRPTLHVELRTGPDDRITSLRVVQTDPEGKGRVWPQRLAVWLSGPAGDTLLPVDLDGPSAEIPAARGLPAPDIVLPSADGMAYGDFRLDPGSRAALVERLPDLPTPLLRGVTWVTLHDAMLEGDVPPDTILALAMRALPRESAELNVQRAVSIAGSAFWRYLAPDARRRAAPALEAALWRGLESAPSPSMKAVYWRAFVDVALTDSAVERVRRLWSGALSVPGLDLSERDRTSMALELAVRGVSDADSILAAQLGAVKDPDRHARLKFLLPAVSANPAVRDSFFASLSEPGNRKHESWVLEGVGYLHHPLRSARAVRYIEPSLEMLETIQRTGDIFFPGRWMDATLGGHQESAAAAVVRRFLAERPDYPPKLREKILQAADGLFRAARITGGDAADEGAPQAR